MKKKSRAEKWLLLLILLLLFAAGLWICRDQKQEQNKMEPNAVVGILPGKTKEQIQEELNWQIGEKMIAFSINSHMRVGLDTGQGDILFENPSSNGKLTRLELYRDDTGERIYETGLLYPGSYVPSAELKEKLPAGEYLCTAYIIAYRLESEEYIGRVAAGITVTVEEEGSSEGNDGK